MSINKVITVKTLNVTEDFPSKEQHSDCSNNLSISLPIDFKLDNIALSTAIIREIERQRALISVTPKVLDS